MLQRNFVENPMPRRRLPSLSALPLLLAVLGGAALAQTPAVTSAMAPDIPANKFSATVPNADYLKQEVMIPMRDGVKLHTVIVIPKGLSRAPIMLTRTPYNASRRAGRTRSP